MLYSPKFLLFFLCFIFVHSHPNWSKMLKIFIGNRIILLILYSAINILRINTLLLVYSVRNEIFFNSRRSLLDGLWRANWNAEENALDCNGRNELRRHGGNVSCSTLYTRSWKLLSQQKLLYWISPPLSL